VTKKSKVGLTVESLGTYLREQRVAAELSLRQLAEQAGVSNPYLSQIERGLRRPSAEVLQALAKALRISAEQVYVQAGILNPDDDEVRSVELAILADPVLTERQKQALLETYKAFRAVSALAEPVDVPDHQTEQPLLEDETRGTTDVSAGTPGRTTPREGI
jgi:transcriptional regulator with XRE-family HTH domain